MPRTEPRRGVFPAVPAVFDEQGALDLGGRRRAVDFMFDAGEAAHRPPVRRPARQARLNASLTALFTPPPICGPPPAT